MAETVGLLILTAVGAETIFGAATAAVATVIGTSVIVGGAYAAQALFAEDPQKEPTEGQVTTKQATPPRTRNYGQVKVGGPLMFLEMVHNTVGGFPVFVHVIAINHGEIQGVEELWLNENNLTTEPPVAAGGGQVLHKYVNPDGGSYCNLQWERGTDTDVGFAYLHDWAPDIWDASHQGKGVAKMCLVMAQPVQEEFTFVYPGGQPPAARAVIRGVKVWDPRIPAQNKDDPATWTWTMNPVLIALDFHRHKDAMRLAHLDGVLFTPAAITEDWIPAANICEEPIPLAAGGFEPRYDCSGGYELPNAAPKDVLAAMLATCDGQIYQRADGAIGIRVGKHVAPFVTIGDDHILAYDGFRKGDSAFTSVNEISAQYTGRQNDYQATEAMAWRDETDILHRGQVLTTSLRLFWVQSHSQARRLMKIEMARRNPEWQGRIVTDLYGLAAYNERFIWLAIAELEISGTFEITDFQIDTGAGTCTISVSSFEQSAYDWDPALEEGNPPPIPDAAPVEDPIDPPEDLAAGGGASFARSEARAVGDPINIVMTWSPSTRTDVTAVAQYRPSGGDDGSWLAANVQTSQLQAITPLVPTGDSFDVRVAWKVGSRSSEWTTLTGVIA